MNHVFFRMMIFSSSKSKVIFDFNKQADISNWVNVDDGVMGGKSSGSLELHPDGHGIFSGTVSLQNNGGFTLVRYQFPKTKTKGFNKVCLKVKGDGKVYQFRIKSNSTDDHTYVKRFSTSGSWEHVEINLTDLHPTFRGKKLDLPNFTNQEIEEIGMLCGNKKNEDFKLLIDRIELK